MTGGRKAKKPIYAILIHRGRLNQKKQIRPKCRFEGGCQKQRNYGGPYAGYCVPHGRLAAQAREAAAGLYCSEANPAAEEGKRPEAPETEARKAEELEELSEVELTEDIELSEDEAGDHDTIFNHQ